MPPVGNQPAAPPMASGGNLGIGGAGGDPPSDSAGGSVDTGSSDAGGAAQEVYPMLDVLKDFLAPDVPAKGPSESDPERKWTPPETLPDWPGEGIAQHPMIYGGEGYNKILLVNEGKVIWSYGTGKVNDIWMLSNGHVLFAAGGKITEVTPKKEVVWSYDPPSGYSIHSCQPIGLDKVLFVANGLPAKVAIVDKATGSFVVDHTLDDAGDDAHSQFRRIRMTADGTYLLPYLKVGKVVEYDSAFTPIWSYEIQTPWAAIRLRNGNTLITDERDRNVREVNAQGETVWEFTQADLPPNAIQHNTQTSDRLANGNTVIFSSTSGEAPPMIQAIELTADKEVVWVLEDWQNLGPATTAQFLDQPGFPEVPGDLQH